MKPKLILWLSIGVVAVVGVVLAVKPASAGVKNVDAAGVREAVSQGAQVIDVRTPGEYQLGHIPGAVNVPLEQVEGSAGSWDANETYVVYCATGARSAAAVQTMQSLGFNNIRHFQAGLQAWDGELEKGAQSSAQKIQTAGKPVLLEFFTNT